MFSLKIQPALRAVLLAGLVSGSAFASAQASNMETGGLTSQPIGHYDFCKVNPSECMIRSRDRGPERMTDALWQKVTGVNVAVNAAVKPMSDMDIYGKPEVWAYPDAGVGDCEDYALEKRRTLMRQGVSVSNLLITVVRKPDGEGHAVLTLRTDHGDLILDNLTDKVQVWDQTGYHFLKRQSSTHTGRWVTIREGQTPLVAAVK
ncbi:transglutaminase-like cysteine peptidase [Mesorhizobium sp. SB112]|uniref:transglutaminase-like cysteine peptidase n=1 Tax=Mesorhizobium sp. SB112 TaxID=3151853 RepID=UPI003266AEF7